jgi:hypothetical protein
VSRLRASGVKTVQKQCAGDATKRGDPAGGYAGVPTVFLQHTRVSSGGLIREQENPEVREGVGVANQSSPTGFFLESTTSPIPRRSSEQDHNTSRKLVNPLIEFFSSPTLFTARIHFPRVLLHNQGYPKVCPDSLNLSNAGDPFAGISSLSSCSLFSRTRDLIALI